MFPLLPLHGRATVEKVLFKHDVTCSEVEDAFGAADANGWTDELADAPRRRATISSTQVERSLMIIVEPDPRHEVIYLVSVYEPSDEDLRRYDDALQKKR